MLTEVYRVSPTLPLQTYRFANWTVGGGPTWPSEGIYRRRNNLQGLIIQAAHVNVRRPYMIHELSKWSLLNKTKQ
jgi:hypothetical protein